jgi:hypothetical protein
MVSITLRLPTDATLCFMYLFPFSLLIFTLHVSGSHKPIIRGISGCILIHYRLVHVVYCSFACARGLVCGGGFSAVKPPPQTRPLAHANEQHKYYMNQMVVYKNTA